jgi:hypothetical protein
MVQSRLSVRAISTSETLPRIIDYVAKLGATPRRVYSDEENGMMTILIEQDGMSEATVRVIAEKMRASVLVESVHLTFGFS